MNAFLRLFRSDLRTSRNNLMIRLAEVEGERDRIAHNYNTLDASHVRQFKTNSEQAARIKELEAELEDIHNKLSLRTFELSSKIEEVTRAQVFINQLSQQLKAKSQRVERLKKQLAK